MHLATFTNGGVVVHKIRIEDSPCKFSAWFDAQGVLVDCSRIDSRDRAFEVSKAQRALVARAARVVSPVPTRVA